MPKVSNQSASMPSTCSCVREEEEAKKVFWSLGEEEWWRQIFDGKYHQYGHMVFDKGLHGGPKEPGFYASAKAACEYVSEHFGEEEGVALYKKIHSLADGGFCLRIESHSPIPPVQNFQGTPLKKRRRVRVHKYKNS